MITKSNKAEQDCGQINDIQHGDELLSKTTVPAGQENHEEGRPAS
jgi:hypothetical protein